MPIQYINQQEENNFKIIKYEQRIQTHAAISWD